MDERNEFITFLCKGVNSKDPIVSKQFKTIADDMHKKKYISKKERFVIFNPHRLILNQNWKCITSYKSRNGSWSRIL